MSRLVERCPDGPHPAGGPVGHPRLALQLRKRLGKLDIPNGRVVTRYYDQSMPIWRQIFSSPFDYPSQAAVYVPRQLPKPNDPGHSAAVVAGPAGRPA